MISVEFRYIWEYYLTGFIFAQHAMLNDIIQQSTAFHTETSMLTINV
ncbi:MAG TPA: hypothetical protein VNR38_08980 [Ureibacillus sp.]|nr:hypothetical protein [Ureibacillus sp.]